MEGKPVDLGFEALFKRTVEGGTPCDKKKCCQSKRKKVCGFHFYVVLPWNRESGVLFVQYGLFLFGQSVLLFLYDLIEFCFRRCAFRLEGELGTACHEGTECQCD
jgi:hypothetical protein